MLKILFLAFAINVFLLEISLLSVVWLIRNGKYNNGLYLLLEYVAASSYVLK